MFKIITTHTDHRTGSVTRYTLRDKFKTRKGAERAAEKLNYDCSADGKTITYSVDAKVVGVCHES